MQLLFLKKNNKKKKRGFVIKLRIQLTNLIGAFMDLKKLGRHP